MSARTWQWVRNDPIQAGALGFALVATAHAEYTLATATHVHPWVAVAVPGALDLYVIRALQKRKDVLAAVLAMVAANVTSHLIVAGVLEVKWQVISAVGAIAPLIVWRVYSLAGAVSAPAPETAPEPGTDRSARTWRFWKRVRYELADVPEPSAPAPAWVPGYHLDGCDGVHEHEGPVNCVERAKVLESTAPDHVPADWPVSYLVPVPDLPPEYAPVAVHSAALEPRDEEYVSAAREYVSGTDKPSVRGLKTAISVGQERAERLLAYLETEETP